MQVGRALRWALFASPAGGYCARLVPRVHFPAAPSSFAYPAGTPFLYRQKGGKDRFRGWPPLKIPLRHTGVGRCARAPGTAAFTGAGQRHQAKAVSTKANQPTPAVVLRRVPDVGKVSVPRLPCRALAAPAARWPATMPPYGRQCGLEGPPGLHCVRFASQPANLRWSRLWRQCRRFAAGLQMHWRR